MKLAKTSKDSGLSLHSTIQVHESIPFPLIFLQPWRNKVHESIPLIFLNIRSDDFWLSNRTIGNTDACARWDMTWAAGVWALWRERNRRTFAGDQKSASRLKDDTKIQIQQWIAVI
ncbi:hypothetical protein FCM35_KLT07904 [Carex littledalei]|uniref:Uncharacterized protein n=1 Tax=Carex littledalei TaxID=544730 RepID=A0A833QNE2_9POAL|nr:hypothetical protein FCM35_KLT07904 [Carex littledalei]